ncbi:hypothetical protein [Butyrivibrio sp. AC2005]|uniref:hypothetical protein n=1 Tax=Butyrivibrio sp. AC2005 TaxID=1280672 RepID=UPI0012DC2E0C|nr:hypothetical protein [Butyrivibrio sp. AC2005]
MDANTLQKHRWFFNCIYTSEDWHSTHHHARSLTISTLRKKAHAIGYTLNKGCIHYLSKDYPVYSKDIGYNVINESTGTMVWGCYNEAFDHLWTLSEVERFIKEQYIELGLEY